MTYDFLQGPTRCRLSPANLTSRSILTVLPIPGVCVWLYKSEVPVDTGNWSLAACRTEGKLFLQLSSGALGFMHGCMVLFFKSSREFAVPPNTDRGFRHESCPLFWGQAVQPLHVSRRVHPWVSGPSDWQDSRLSHPWLTTCWNQRWTRFYEWPLTNNWCTMMYVWLFMIMFFLDIMMP